MFHYHDVCDAARGGASSQRPARGREKSPLLMHDAQAEPLRREAVVIAAKHRAIVTTRGGKKPAQVGIRFQPFRMAADVEAPAVVATMRARRRVG